MGLPSQKESLNRLVELAQQRNEKLSNQTKLPSNVAVSGITLDAVKTLEDSLMVGISAIIGGPTANAKNVSSLASIAKDNNKSLYSIIENQSKAVSDVQQLIKDYTEKTTEFFDTTSQLSSDFFDKTGDILEEMNQNIVGILDSLQGQSKSGDKAQLIQLAAGDANIGTMLQSLQDFDEKSLDKIEKIVTELNKLNSIDLSKFKEQSENLNEDVIQNLSKTFDDINKMYSENVAAAAVAAEQGQKDIEKINEANKKVEETVVEGKKPDEKQLKQAQSSYEGLASTIMAGAFAMIVGALLIKAFPDFPELALKFTGVFTLFLTAIMVPLVLSKIIISKFGGDKGKGAMEEIAGIIAVCAFVMIIGALFMKIRGLAESALAFSKQLALFFILTIGALTIATWFINPALLESVSRLGNLIIVSTFVMLVGALFMQIDWLPKNALMFGLTLGLFVATILVPFILMSWIGGNKKFVDNIKGVSALIVTCTIVMMTGALFMLLDNGTFVKNALMFGVMLSLFIALVILPFILLKPLIGIAQNTIKDVTGLIIVCTMVMMIGSLFVLLGGGAFVTAALKFTGILSLFMIGCILPILFLYPFMATGLQMLKSLSLFVLISASVLFVGAFFVKKGYAIEALKFTGLFTLYLIAMTGIFALLGVVAPLVGPGAGVAAAMGLALMALAGGFALISIVAERYKDTLNENLIIIGVWIGAIGLMFTAIGFLAVPIAAGSVAILALSIALMAVSGAFALISTIVQNHETLPNDIDVINICIGKIGLLFSAIGLLSPLILIGGVVIALMTPVLTALSLTLLLMTVAANQVAKMPDVSGAVGKIKGFFTLIDGFPSGLKLLKMTLRVMAVTPLALLMSGVLLTMSLAIAAIANLRVIEEWDNKGKPKKYRNLSESDFTNASRNVATVITTLADALIGVYCLRPDLFKTGKDSVIFTVIEASKEMGGVISSIAEGLQSYANLMIPDQSNEEGKPIHFRKFGMEDFKNAARGIGLIISTLGQSILDFIDANPVLVGYMEETRGGFLNLSKSPSKFAMVCASGKSIGDLIGSIATGLTAYANMQYPTHWNAEGKPDKFAPMTDPMIESAKEHIINILTDMSLAIADAYDAINRTGFWGGIFGSPQKVKEKIECFTGIGVIISGIAEGLSKYAGLMIPIEWNKDGKPIKFRPMSSTEIEDARANIVDILTTMAVAVSDAYYSIPGSAAEIKSRIEAFIPLGDLINSFAIGIQAYANLAIPTAWNKDGKPTNFKPMIKDDFELAAYNIQVIMLTAALGLKQAYNSLIKGNDGIKLDDLGKFTEAFKPIGEIIADVVKALQGYANLNMPVAWDKNGKPIKFEKFDETAITAVKTKIPNIIGALAESILIASKDESVVQLISKGGQKDLENLRTLTEDISSLIGEIGGIVIAIADWKIPTGFDKDGKATGYKQLGKEGVDKLAENLKLLLITIPKTIIETCISGETASMFGKTIPDNMESIIGVIQSASEIISAAIEGTTQLDEFSKSIETIKNVSKDIVKHASGIVDLSESELLINDALLQFSNIASIMSAAFGTKKNMQSIINPSLKMLKVDFDFDVNTIKIQNHVEWLNEITTTLAQTSNLADSVKKDAFKNIGESVSTLNEYLDGIGLQNVWVFENEVDAVDKFVKVVDKVKVNNVMHLTRLLEQINQLSSHMGSLDKFAKVLAEQLAATLDQLAKQIRDAQRTIKDADRIQRQRHELINNSVAKVQKMMETTLHVDVTSTTTSSETTSTATEEQR